MTALVNLVAIAAGVFLYWRGYKFGFKRGAEHQRRLMVESTIEIAKRAYDRGAVTTLDRLLGRNWTSN